MKNFVMLILAVIAVWFVWHIIMGLFASVIHIAIIIGMIALFVWLVSSVYKALTREKVKY
jgi:membrane associated rhomboid family serine protease